MPLMSLIFTNRVEIWAKLLVNVLKIHRPCCNPLYVNVDLVGVVSHVIASEQFCVLMMTESCVLDSLEHPEDGKQILQKWKELKNSKLETGFVYVPH